MLIKPPLVASNIHMDNIKQAVSQVVDKVEEVVGGNTPVAPQQPVVSSPVSAPFVEASEDRSAYNCVSCKGEGIVNNVICSVCSGTGKV